MSFSLATEAASVLAKADAAVPLGTLMCLVTGKGHHWFLTERSNFPLLVQKKKFFKSLLMMRMCFRAVFRQEKGKKITAFLGPFQCSWESDR